MKLIILDRDGVINIDSPNYIRTLADWRPIPGSLEAIAALTQAGYTVTIATNQSGLAWGYYGLETLEAIHARMQSLVTALGGHIDLIVYCPHLPELNCDCRKPKPGLLLNIAKVYGLLPEQLVGVPFVGDNLTDVGAARAVGARPMLVQTGYRVIEPPAGVEVFPDLAAATQFLLHS